MVKSRNQTLRRKAFERDNFTCQKCGLSDEKMIKIEAHHIISLCYGGNDELANLITLCFDCHKYAPDKKEDFQKYMEEEMDGTSTTLIKAIEKVRIERLELFNGTPLTR